jgi:hypothetical protein
MINFGSYCEKVKFKSFGEVPDGYGDVVPIFEDVLSTTARIIQVGKGRDLEALQIKFPNTYTMGIQWRSGFEPDPSMMVEYKGFIHAITGVSLNQERMRREWIITIVRGEPSPSYNGLLNQELNTEL